MNKRKKGNRWKSEHMTPGHRVLVSGALQSLMMKRCKEFNDALANNLVTMEELREFAWEHNLNFKREYVEKVKNIELFPPKEISEYIRRKRDNEGRIATKCAVKNISAHKPKTTIEAARLARRARAMDAQKIIDDTISYLANPTDTIKE